MLVWSSLALAACATKQVEAPRSTARTPTPAPSRPAPAMPIAEGVELYAPDEALRDALSGPWEHIGTGEWPGIRRTHACAFRNERVLVVNVYCTITEQQAFRVDVYSPTRGRVRFYAESNGPVSTFRRAEYFTFMAESEPPPAPESGLGPLTLNISFPELRAYDEKRYDAFLPACYGGTEHNRPKGGCLDALASHAPAWSQRNQAFLDHPGDDWYRLVREMRALATRYGKEAQ